MTEQYFHFTLGPVQGFVAQARRTRDFWAGSFLLSFLSAVAIKSVQAQGGELIFPAVDPDYLGWLENKGKGSPPQQGCIPNRFKGGTAKVPGDFKPLLIEDSIQEAWKGLASAVWEHDLKDCSKDTQKIWKRQVENFWEMSWVMTDSDESNFLDRRKNWRSYLPPKEAGVKCMMMDGWQELSAIKTPNSKGLALFWETLRQQSSSLNNDLREKEYLCAIAFIKRRFSHVFNGFTQELSSGWTVSGWKVNSSVPSVSYMAAAPWLAKVIQHAPEAVLNTFCASAGKLTNKYGKSSTKIACVTEAINNKGYTKELWDFKSLDGDVFFEAALDNKNRHADTTQVKSDLRKLIQSVNEFNLEAVSPFYAVLMMDGDSLGAQMSNLDKQAAISQSLNAFTQGVASIVTQQSGFLIYAGGDDVLALLPLEQALKCAQALRQHYLQSFADHGQWSGGQVQSTLSGAIEYAHIKMPLGKVLADAHHLLDDIAKEAYGRDALAVRVWKPGGQHLQWAMPWKIAIDNGQVVLDDLADKFRKTEQETPFSSAFIFNIEARFSMLQSKNAQDEWQLADDFDKEIITTLIAVEYLNSGVNIKRSPKLTLAEAKVSIEPLIKQCMPEKRIFEAGKEDKFKAMNQLNIDAAHLLLFLANKGVDHG